MESCDAYGLQLVAIQSQQKNDEVMAALRAENGKKLSTHFVTFEEWADVTV